MNLLILKEKHGERYFAYNTLEELQLIARLIVSERIEEGYYEDETRGKILKDIYSVAYPDDGKAAMRVLDARSRWEYEGYELTTTETVEGVKL